MKEQEERTGLRWKFFRERGTALAFHQSAPAGCFKKGDVINAGGRERSEAAQSPRGTETAQLARVNLRREFAGRLREFRTCGDGIEPLLQYHGRNDQRTII